MARLQRRVWIGLVGITVMAQAQRLTLTSHVPAEVARGEAQRIGALPADQRVNLAISLPLRNEAALDALLRQITDPGSPNYRHYLSVQEFTETFGPTLQDRDAIAQFALTHGLAVTRTPANRLVVELEGPVARIEEALHLKLGLYQHPAEARLFYAPDREPTLDLAVPVLHISGLDNFAPPQPKNVRPARAAEAAGKTTGSGPGGNFTGSDLRAAYYGSGPLTGAGQIVGLVEFGGYDPSDIQRYFQKVNQPLNVPLVDVSLNNVPVHCDSTKCDDSEQAIDIETVISMAPGLQQVTVYVGSRDVSVFNQMASDNTAKQLSCSWGWKDNESTLDPILKEFIAQGQTLFVASGDGGSKTPAGYVWPADDPYVTAVGGTDLTTMGPGGPWQSETGWKYSAGMPSKNGVPIPRYQKLAGVIDAKNGGSRTLRDIPDVAAEANTNLFSCYDATCSGGNGGTSYAAPQWAGFMAMLNEQAVENGATVIGFLNPSLYRTGVGTNYASDFHDITSGSNGAYSAVAGYDLVTGWGSFNGPNLIAALIGSE